MSDVNVSSNDVSQSSENGERNDAPRRRKPAFNIPDFDPNNTDHLKGIVTPSMNSIFCFSLVNILSNIDLDPEEAHVFAFYSKMKNFYDDRRAFFREKHKKDESHTGALVDKAPV